MEEYDVGGIVDELRKHKMIAPDDDCQDDCTRLGFILIVPL